MNIHEYQAKGVLTKFGVPGAARRSRVRVDEAVKGAHDSRGSGLGRGEGSDPCRGRGKAGGVKVVKSIDDVKKEATANLGSTWSRTRPARKAKKVNRPLRRRRAQQSTRSLPGRLLDRETSRGRHRRADGRRYGHRGSRAQNSRKDSDFPVDPATELCRITAAGGTDAEADRRSRQADRGNCCPSSMRRS